MMSVPPNLQFALAGVGLVLCVSSACVWGLALLRSAAVLDELKVRTRSWWVMASFLALTVLLGRGATVAVFAFISFLALKEYLSLVPLRQADRPFLLLDYGAVGARDGRRANRIDEFQILVPLYALMVVPASMAFTARANGFLAAAAIRVFGVLMTVYFLGFVPLISALPDAENPAGGGLALAVYLVFLAQFNDVAQYVWGKLLGRRRIVASISPGKTWEGFVGGIAVTVPLAAFLALWLTPFSFQLGALAGGLIALSGFAGDVVLSAVKRDLGVKDTSHMIPGHGGILDRVDSLLFSGPLLYLLIGSTFARTGG
jgi:phosphatidate cytidylyltransferase